MPGRRAGGWPWQAFLDGLSPARHGALIYVCAGLVFVATDSLTKSLVAHLPVVHVVFGRHVSYLVAILVIAGGRHPRRLLATTRPWTQLARGLAMFGATATFFLALSLLPMAEVSALGSTTPLIVVALAGPILGERVTRFAIVGAVIGFAGVVLVAGLDPSTLDLAVVVPLASAFSLAIFSLLTRSLRSDPTDVTVFISGVVGLAAASLLELVVATPTMPTTGEWVGIGIVGLGALTGHRLLVAAYRWGRASDLAPLGYLSIAWSFLVGTLVFGEALIPRALAGAAAIATGGLMAIRGTPPEEDAPPTQADYGGPVALDVPDDDVPAGDGATPSPQSTRADD
jgi:drug/metabolite transporter (DMT)-like permease